MSKTNASDPKAVPGQRLEPLMQWFGLLFGLGGLMGATLTELREIALWLYIPTVVITGALAINAVIRILADTLLFLRSLRAGRPHSSAPPLIFSISPPKIESKDTADISTVSVKGLWHPNHDVRFFFNVHSVDPRLNYESHAPILPLNEVVKRQGKTKIFQFDFRKSLAELRQRSESLPYEERAKAPIQVKIRVVAQDLTIKSSDLALSELDIFFPIPLEEPRRFLIGLALLPVVTALQLIVSIIVSPWTSLAGVLRILAPGKGVKPPRAFAYRLQFIDNPEEFTQVVAVRYVLISLADPSEKNVRDIRPILSPGGWVVYLDSPKDPSQYLIRVEAIDYSGTIWRSELMPAEVVIPLKLERQNQ